MNELILPRPVAFNVPCELFVRIQKCLLKICHFYVVPLHMRLKQRGEVIVDGKFRIPNTKNVFECSSECAYEREIGRDRRDIV